MLIEIITRVFPTYILQETQVWEVPYVGLWHSLCSFCLFVTFVIWLVENSKGTRHSTACSAFTLSTMTYMC